MAKYEAIINVSVEVDATSEEAASKIVYGELTNRMLDIASRDDQFKLWMDVIEINELGE